MSTAKKTEHAIKIPSGIVRILRLSELQIDTSYQRGLKPHHKRIAKHLDRAAVGSLHVGNRGEQGYFLIDGQQRREALLLNNVYEWPCTVVPSSGSQYEAMIFKMINGQDRAQLSKQELFKACLTANDPVALAVQRACEKAGWKLKLSHGGGKTWPNVACVGTLYRNCQMSGEELLTRAIMLAENCWPQSDDVLIDVVPGGFCALLRMYGDKIDDGIMLQAVQKVPVRKLILEAATGLSNRQSEFAGALAVLYNKKVRGAKKLEVRGRRLPRGATVSDRSNQSKPPIMTDGPTEPAE